MERTLFTLAVNMLTFKIIYEYSMDKQKKLESYTNYCNWCEISLCCLFGNM